MILNRVAIAATLAILTVNAHAGQVPTIPELDRLENKDRRVSVELENVAALQVLNAIAIAAGVLLQFDGPEDCCTMSIDLEEVPLKQALEAVAAQGDVELGVVDSNTLHVHLPVFTQPVLLNSIEPKYPKDARDARAEGTVVIGAVIQEDGNVGDAQVLTGTEGWPSFDEAVLAAVSGRCYLPATRDGQPITFPFVIRVEFRLR